MSGNWSFRGLLVAAGLVLSLAARADLYSADAAYRVKDFPKAFGLYRELAELGRAEAQENLAIMYVSGEGVPRNNVLGFAWASLVIEQQPSEAAQGIVDQLRPHLSEAGRKTAEELRAKFGKEALLKSIVPTVAAGARPSVPASAIVCKMTRPANIDDFYPTEAAANNVSGFAIISARVFSDGRDHDPRADRLIPAQPFDGAAMLVSMNNGYAKQDAPDESHACSIRFKVKFSARGARRAEAPNAVDESGRKGAQGGDPDSQLFYGLLLSNLAVDSPEAGDPFPWLLKAAQAGNAFAQYLVGSSQLHRGLFAKNDAKAVFWLEKASDAGDSDAQLELANYYLRDTSNGEKVRRAAQLLGRAVESHRPEARFYLAALLASNRDENVRDPKRALTLISEGRSIYDLNPVAYEIRAAAHAWLGEYDDARSDQKHAVFMAKRFHWNTAPQEARLAAYGADKTWTGDLLAYY